MTPLTPVAPAPTSAAQPTEMLVVWGDRNEPKSGRTRPVVADVTVIADPGYWSREFQRFLTAEGFAIVIDPEGDSAFDHRSRSADAAIVDLQLTARSAAAVCVAWQCRSRAPVLALAGPRDEAAVLAAFEAGFDRVVSREMTFRQIVAHLRSLLRRVPPRGKDVDVPSQGLSVQLGSDGRSAVLVGQTVRLAEEESQMLALLLGRPGRVVTRAELASTVVYSSGGARAVDFAIRRLREKLEEVDGQRRIIVVRGVGFRFDNGSDAVVDLREDGAPLGEDLP